MDTDDPKLELPPGKGKTNEDLYLNDARIIAANERYLAAAHAVQSGVKYDPDSASQEPKHLRTGIDLMKAEQAGLVDLLIRKGVFTRVEYHEAMADAVETEKRRYETYLTKKFGKTVTLA